MTVNNQISMERIEIFRNSVQECTLIGQKKILKWFQIVSSLVWQHLQYERNN